MSKKITSFSDAVTLTFDLRPWKTIRKTITSPDPSDTGHIIIKKNYINLSLKTFAKMDHHLTGA